MSKELEASFKKIEEGDIIAGTVVSVDETGVVLDLKYYAEGFIRQRNFPESRDLIYKVGSSAGRRDPGNRS